MAKKEQIVLVILVPCALLMVYVFFVKLYYTIVACLTLFTNNGSLFTNQILRGLLCACAHVPCST